MTHLKQLKQQVLIALFLSPSLTVFGAFTLMTDFEDISSGTTVAALKDANANSWQGTNNASTSSKITFFPETVDNKVLEVSYSSQSNYIAMIFPSGLEITGGTTGTVFFQAYFSDPTTTGISFGVGSTSAGGNPDRMQSQIQLTGGALKVYSGSSNSLSVTGPTSIISGEWYSFWILLNSPVEGSYEVYLQHGDSKLIKMVTAGLTKGFSFRNFDNVDWENYDTNRFSISFTSSNSAITYFDNFWIDPTGLNRTNPLIPEPTTYAFVGVVGLLAAIATRRRRWKKH
jgi:hypothetical protein